MSKSGRGGSISRTIRYEFEIGPNDQDFAEGPVERLLEQAKQAGLVTNFDTGRGRIVWFFGHPGPALRELRDEILRMVPKLRRVPK